MPALSADIEVLLMELRNRLVVPESYSRRSIAGRLAPVLLTTVLALVAVIGGMLICELTASRPSERDRAVRPS